MHPVPLFDRLTFQRSSAGIHLTCSHPSLPIDSSNLVYRAASRFLETSKINDGLTIHLEKNIPLAAGLGGGSGNAATALTGLNELFDRPLASHQLENIAASLGSDVPFFLQEKPALATGRGEKIQSLEFFPALSGAAFLLLHPGFGIATAWAYQQLARFPSALSGQPGRGEKLLARLRQADLKAAGAEFYNSLEAPALEKYPILALFQDFLRSSGAAATLMSGSGSTTFAVTRDLVSAQELSEKLKSKFGPNNWIAVVPAAKA
jgi:4-diphosphocytidyl-2-C-methyl-D-erythritol kinase